MALAAVHTSAAAVPLLGVLCSVNHYRTCCGQRVSADLRSSWQGLTRLPCVTCVNSSGVRVWFCVYGPEVQYNSLTRVSTFERFFDGLLV